MDEIVQKLIDKLYTPEGEIVRNVIEVLGNISLHQHYFDLVIEKILQVCFDNMSVREKNSDVIVKKLCAILDGRKVFMSLSSKLQNFEDVEFISNFVQSLDLILLTDKQLSDVRQLLRNLKYDKENSEKAVAAFEKFFPTW